METSSHKVQALRGQIAATEKELVKLKEQLAAIDEKANGDDGETKTSKWPFTPEEYLRYGRQMIVPSIGMEGKSHEP